MHEHMYSLRFEKSSTVSPFQGPFQQSTEYKFFICKGRQTLLPRIRNFITAHVESRDQVRQMHGPRGDGVVHGLQLLPGDLAVVPEHPEVVVVVGRVQVRQVRLADGDVFRGGVGVQLLVPLLQKLLLKSGSAAMSDQRLRRGSRLSFDAAKFSIGMFSV